MLSVSTACGSNTDKWRCICRVRSCTEPSISPTTTAARLPNRISPGPSQSAPKLTKQPMVRRAPSARAMANSFRPFCADNTYPPGARWGLSMASAASVACAFTASTMVSYSPCTCCGKTAGTTWRNCSTGPVMLSPVVRHAATCSATMSTISTGRPARVQYAPSTPPMAPAPQTRIGRAAVVTLVPWRAGRDASRPSVPRRW